MQVMKFQNGKVTLELSDEQFLLMAFSVDAVNNCFDQVKPYMADYTEEDVDKLSSELDLINDEVIKVLTVEAAQ